MENEVKKDHILRKCNLCPREEFMHKFDRFCKKCKSSGKNRENKTYRIEMP